MEKTTVEMGDIIEKMRDHMPESFLRKYVLLAASLAVFARYDGSAIQAIFLGSLWNMGQLKIFLKNRYKNTRVLSFSFTEQIRYF